ncbi:unnamed protein product, partial [Timema podura]|nr:unnamed protein product [Timema podura]
GTTWTQEMVWCIANDLDFQAAKVPLPERFPFLDNQSVLQLTINRCSSSHSITSPTHTQSLLQLTINRCSSSHSITSPAHTQSLLQLTINHCSNSHSITSPTHNQSLLQLTLNRFSNSHSIASPTHNQSLLHLTLNHFSNSHSIASPTHTQALLQLILNHCSNSQHSKRKLHSPLFDYTDILPRIPDLQLPTFVLDSVQHIADLPSPRFIKTHLPWSLLPGQIRTGDRRPKIVYVARNAKDTCVSYYHHCTLMEGYQGDFEDFCKLFLGDTLCFAPFWSHVLGFWKRRQEPNILFLKYEDMKKVGTKCSSLCLRTG